MNANAVAKHYANLTPEERFRLILAASGRGDDAEQERLLRAGGRITLSLPDHSPYAHAFDELALLTYIELLEEAARYLDAWVGFDDVGDVNGVNPEAEPEENPEGPNTPAEASDGKEADQPLWRRSLDLALAAGYVLKTKTDGWKLFCDRLNVPPLLLWEIFPGYDRLQRAVALADQAAFTAEGFLRWLNRVRPRGEPALTQVPLTAESVADATEEAFRQRIHWWGG